MHRGDSDKCNSKGPDSNMFFLKLWDPVEFSIGLTPPSFPVCRAIYMWVRRVKCTLVSPAGVGQISIILLKVESFVYCRLAGEWDCVCLQMYITGSDVSKALYSNIWNFHLFVYLPYFGEFYLSLFSHSSVRT